MTRGLTIALALFALNTGFWNTGFWTSSAWAQGAPQCADFPRLSADTKKKADAVQAAMKAKVDRKQVCTLMTSFVASEAVVVKFLDDNKTWCGVPDQAIAISKTNHEKSVKFRNAACADDASGTSAKRVGTKCRWSAACASRRHGGIGSVSSKR